MALRLGIDVGGTFTDLFMHDSETGRVWLAKTPTTPRDQSIGVLEGIRQICERAEVDRTALDAVLHGTTVATNAVLEGKGARVGLLLTAGWRNLLYLAESWTPGPLFGFFNYQRPTELVPYEDIREVAGRLGARGQEFVPLDEATTRRVIGELIDSGVEALTICLMNAHANPAHEQTVLALAQEEMRTRSVSLPISVSSEISPEFREYERAVTTVMNSYVGPVMRRYLTTLESKLAEGGIQSSLQVVRSDGGLMSVAGARERPVNTVLSGPSGGVNGAAFIASRAGFDRILTFDMGGTSTDVAVCEGGSPTVTRETRVGPFPVRAPAVNVESIGAGGGSIAFVSPVTGALRVGPESAGAVPGPACYGHGGTSATVTDANVVLGHLPPTLLGGAMTLDVAAAHTAMETLAGEMGLDVHRAARGIVDIVNENMLGALRVVTVQRGLDPSGFALVSFGGAGGLHANALAATLGCYPVIIPPEPGVLSALGFIAADVRNEFSQSLMRTTERTSIGEIRGIFGSLQTRAREWLVAEHVPTDEQIVHFVADMRYERQGYEIPVEVDGGELDALELEGYAERFRAAHHLLYGFSLPGSVEVVTLRSRAVGRVAKPNLVVADAAGGGVSSALVGTHPIWQGDAMEDAPLYERRRLQVGMVVPGPAVVMQYDATTLILAGHSAVVDPWLNLLIRRTP